MKHVTPLSAENRLPILTTLGTITVVVASGVVDFVFGNPVLSPVSLLAAVANTIFLLWRRHEEPVAHGGARRPLLSRPGLWLATILSMPVSYILGGPFVIVAVQRHVPAAMPIAAVVYWPLREYVRHPELPGSDLFKGYARAVEGAFR